MTKEKLKEYIDKELEQVKDMSDHEAVLFLIASLVMVQEILDDLELERPVELIEEEKEEALMEVEDE